MHALRIEYEQSHLHIGNAAQGKNPNFMAIAFSQSLKVHKMKPRKYRQADLSAVDRSAWGWTFPGLQGGNVGNMETRSSGL